MIHTVHKIPEGTGHCFVTEQGTILVTVATDGDAGTVTMYEWNAALASAGLDDVEAHAHPTMAAARNRFGVATMRAIRRAIREKMPEVKRWLYERKSGPNNGRQYARCR